MAAIPDKPETKTRRTTLLCIDDEELGLQVRKLMLEEQGYEVLTATSGATGLDLLRRRHVDAVILDYQMPEMTGAEVAEAIRAMKPGIPLLMLSGFTESVPKEALHIIHALVTKGGPPEDLLAILKDALQGESATACIILNVDDNPQHRYALTRALRQAGFTVIEASNGWEAIAKASARPNIILLDINLPDISGFEVCRQLKADPVTRSIPIIQISASHDSESAESESLRAGAEMFMEQPQDLAIVVQVVRKQIARHYPAVQ